MRTMNDSISTVGDNLKVDEFIGNDPSSFFGSTNTQKHSLIIMHQPIIRKVILN